jgi:hypothetical protein
MSGAIASILYGWDLTGLRAQNQVLMDTLEAVDIEGLHNMYSRWGTLPLWLGKVVQRFSEGNNEKLGALPDTLTRYPGENEHIVMDWGEKLLQQCHETIAEDPDRYPLAEHEMDAIRFIIRGIPQLQIVWHNY